MDREARLVEVNDYWLKTMGYERNEVIGRKVLDFYTEESRKYAQDVTQPTFFREGIAKDLSYQFVKKSGEVLDVLLSATSERDASGNVVRSQALIEDITERKRAEAALRESEERFRSLSNASLEGIMIHDRGVILDANVAFARLFGYEQPEELIGKNGIELLLIPEARVRIHQRIQRHEKGPLEVIGVRKDGTTFVGETDSQPIKYRGHDVRIVSCRDITKRKRSEEAQRETEIRFRAVFENSRDAIDISKNGVHCFANPAYLILFGHESNEKIVGTSILDDIAPSHRQQILQNIRRRTDREPIPPTYVTRGRKTDGTEFYMEISAAAFEMQGETYSVASIRDITERRLAEEERERLTVAIEQTGETVVVTDAEGTIQYVNPMFEAVTGYSRTEAVGQNPRILKSGKHDKAFYLELWNTIASGRVWQGRFVNRKKDGSLYIEDASISPVHDNEGRIVNYVAVKRDVSEHLRAFEERAKLEDQLRQAQKMESIGTLAGGIAHDFNNILTAIIGYGNVALMKMAKDDPQRLNIEHMLDAANRAAHLTKDLLLFSRKQISERKPLDLNNVIRKVETFLRRVIGEDIECKATQFAGALPILGDAHQLEQVLMNLATNARDAMPKGGVFSVTTDQVKFDNESISIDGYVKPGNYALITISDTGKGMDEATRDHIFEPFFTTKEVGKGTGLGLAVVYGIIKQHEGTINVYSESGRGTTFTIYLPLIVAPVDATTSPVEERPTGGTETILLAEDDENVRKLTRTVLEDFGYKVITAFDGQDAVIKYKENKDKIQLLLFDIIMPKTTGKEAYDEIKAITPEVKVLFVSGYALTTSVKGC
ncbi:MAG: PAS domain S-box protein [Syntrophobacteraceae bacterium]